MPERKKKPRPWDKSEEDIPDVIWGGRPKSSDSSGPQSGVFDPFQNLPIPQMEQPLS